MKCDAGWTVRIDKPKVERAFDLGIVGTVGRIAINSVVIGDNDRIVVAWVQVVSGQHVIVKYPVKSIVALQLVSARRIIEYLDVQRVDLIER